MGKGRVSPEITPDEIDYELCGGCEEWVRPNKIVEGLCDVCRKKQADKNGCPT